MAENQPNLDAVNAAVSFASSSPVGEAGRRAFEAQAVQSMGLAERGALEAHKIGAEVADFALTLRASVDMLCHLPIFTGHRYETDQHLEADAQAANRAEGLFFAAIDKRARERIIKQTGQAGFEAAIATVNALNPRDAEVQVTNAEGKTETRLWRRSEAVALDEGAVVAEASGVKEANGQIEFGGGLQGSLVDIQKAITDGRVIVRHRLFYFEAADDLSRPDVAVPITSVDRKITYVVLKGKQVDELYKHTKWADQEEKEKRYGKPAAEVVKPAATAINYASEKPETFWRRSQGRQTEKPAEEIPEEKVQSRMLPSEELRESRRDLWRREIIEAWTQANGPRLGADGQPRPEFEQFVSGLEQRVDNIEKASLEFAAQLAR